MRNDRGYWIKIRENIMNENALCKEIKLQHHVTLRS